MIGSVMDSTSLFLWAMESRTSAVEWAAGEGEESRADEGTVAVGCTGGAGGGGIPLGFPGPKLVLIAGGAIFFMKEGAGGAGILVVATGSAAGGAGSTGSS